MQLSRLENGQLLRDEQLKRVIPHTSTYEEGWLFIAPHDDDIVIGGGLLLQQAVSEGKRIKILITTDGSMGYCDLEQMDSIADIRRRETLESFDKIGIRDVEWLDYPDANLMRHIGRRLAAGGRQHAKPEEIAGFTGLQNSFTAHLRAFRPSHVFVMSENDYNPDHKVVHQEVLISLFHAEGAIWPELGKALAERPHVYEMAAYCNFKEDPNVEIAASPAELEQKLEAVYAFQSQKQIGMLVENLKQNGPYEYLRDLGFDYYSPARYRTLFHKNESIGESR
ncbi:MAG: PIG-L deacetylase family protein [Spirochaetia bacterium]